MHYHDINPNEHLLMLIIHTMQILQTSVVRADPLPGNRDAMRTITDYMAGPLARQYFPYRLNFSIDAAYSAREVLGHVLVQPTHRQLTIQKCLSCQQVSNTSYTKLYVPMRL